MRIAILGGSFNPVHNGHLIVAKEVLKQLDCDQVWLLPCFKQAEGKSLEKPRHRLAMAKVAIKGLERIKASGLEIRFLKKKNYTADTIRFLQKRFPGTQFYWIFGSELVREFPRWEKWDKLRKSIPLVIYPRKGVKITKVNLNANLFFLPSSVKQSAISSTKVRAMLERKDNRVKKLIPAEVFAYIRRHKLYGWIE